MTGQETRAYEDSSNLTPKQPILAPLPDYSSIRFDALKSLTPSPPAPPRFILQRKQREALRRSREQSEIPDFRK